MYMTKYLEQAIEQVRELPAEEQDAAADVLFAYVSSEERQYTLRPEQVADVRRIHDGLRTGATRLATDGEVATARRRK
jgi:hypothetical protein